VEKLGSDNSPTYGYLLVVEDPQHGFTGGLLTVCDRGRPLEFHCTEPVQPSRAQEILFGPTLRSYLLSECLGSALLSKAKLSISVLLVSDPDTVAAGGALGIPTVIMATEDEASNQGAPEALQQLEHLASAIDPSEPFERVREAIHEAQRLMVGDPSAAGETRDAA
jgi:hypothetical protein